MRQMISKRMTVSMRAAMMLAVVMMAMFTSPSGAWAQNPGVVATVQSTGQVQPVEYTDLEAAFKAAKNNDEITLQANCALAVDATHTGKLVLGNGTDETDVVLDLNGHTISGKANELITVTTNAYLRITDGSTGGKGSIVTTGAKAILNVGIMSLNRGSVSGKVCGIYSQGNVAIGGGTVIGGSTDGSGGTVSETYGLYIEQGVANISGGTFVASGTGGIGIECVNSNGFYILGLPTFNCTVADISLAKDQKIEFSGDITAAPTKKIKVKVANKAPYMFAIDYVRRVWNEVDGTLDPQTVFEYYDASAGLSFDIDDGGSDVVIAKRYALSSKNDNSLFFIYRKDALWPVTMAAEGQTVIVGLDDQAAIPEGQYFTDAFTSDQTTVTAIGDDGRGIPSGYCQFTMPAETVTVAAVFAEQQEYIIDLSTATSAVIPESVNMLLGYIKVGDAYCLVYDNEGNLFLDLNVDGVNDLKVKDAPDGIGKYVYSIERLSGESVYATNCHIALVTPTPKQYNSLFFKLEVDKPLDIEDSWISIAKGPFTYTGQAIEPQVTVTADGTDVKDYFDITYESNVNTGEAKVTIAAKSGQTAYTGSVSKTFTIQPKPVTVTGGLTASKVTVKGITVYSVDASNATITGAVNNENLSVIGVVARLKNGSTNECNLDYTAATIVIGAEKANNYVLAQEGNQATAEIIAFSETETGGDGSQIEKETTFYASGAVRVRQTTTDAEGYQSGINLTVSPDGSQEVIQITTEYADESVTLETVSVLESNEDGSTTRTETETETTKDVTGAVTQTKSTTTETITKTEEKADGSVTDTESVKITESDGAGENRVIGESTCVTKIFPDGTTEEEVSASPELGEESYSLNEEGELEVEPDGKEDDNYKEIVDDMSDVIQNNAGVSDGNDDKDERVSALIRLSGAGNLLVNTNEVTNAEGDVISQGASITVKEAGSAGSIAEASGDSEPSAQLALYTFEYSKPNSGSISDEEGSMSWKYSGSTLTISGKGMMKEGRPWNKDKKIIKIVTIEDGVTNIASGAFSGLKKLKKVNIASSVVNIGSNAFKGCTNLQKVNIAEGSQLMTIGNGAFSKLKRISSITLPSSVTYIAEGAFKLYKKNLYVLVPTGKALSVRIQDVDETQVIKPTNGKVNIIKCLFQNKKRKKSRALVLQIVDPGDVGDDSGDDDDDEDEDEEDEEEDEDEDEDEEDGAGTRGSAGIRGIGGALTPKMATATVTFNFETKSEGMAGLPLKISVSANTLASSTIAQADYLKSRGADESEKENDELEIESGKEYDILRDGYFVLNFYTAGGSITVNSIVFRRPGDANNNGFVDAADLVEMINAKNGKASERFNLTNADIDRDGEITQDDIDAVVEMIMDKTTD